MSRCPPNGTPSDAEQLCSTSASVKTPVTQCARGSQTLVPPTKNRERDKGNKASVPPNVGMNSFARVEIVGHADQQNSQLHSGCLEDDHVGAEEQKQPRQSGSKYADRAYNHQPLLRFRAIAQQKSGGYQRRKKNQADDLKGQKAERWRTSRRSETPLRRLHRHNPAERRSVSTKGLATPGEPANWKKQCHEG